MGHKSFDFLPVCFPAAAEENEQQWHSSGHRCSSAGKAEVPENSLYCAEWQREEHECVSICSRFPFQLFCSIYVLFVNRFLILFSQEYHYKINLNTGTKQQSFTQNLLILAIFKGIKLHHCFVWKFIPLDLISWFMQSIFCRTLYSFFFFFFIKNCCDEAGLIFLYYKHLGLFYRC